MRLFTIGAQGTVKQATHLPTGQVVALKSIKKETGKNALQALIDWSLISFPPRFYDLSEEGRERGYCA